MSIITLIKNKLKISNGRGNFPVGQSIDISKDFKLGRYFNVKIFDKAVNVTIGSNVIFNEFCSILMFKNASLKIGNNVFFNNYCSINCLEQISVGSNTMFGEGVRMYDHNHAYEMTHELKVYQNKYTTSTISIGENCWIGSNVTILKGVTIGNNVIIGANCLIYKSIPSNSVVKSAHDLIVNSI